jgi:hypothetical protein
VLADWPKMFRATSTPTTEEADDDDHDADPAH